MTAIVVGGQAVHVLYGKGVEANVHHLVYRRADAPSSFEPDTASIDAIAAVVDPMDTLHVVTHDRVANNLRYQRRSSTGAWSAPQAIAATSGGLDVSLASDGTGALHLAWTDPQQHLMYARCASP
jgi:hypothetical protein